MKDNVIGLAHGSGGRKTARLIRELFLTYLGNPILERLEDSAELPSDRGRIALTTDSHVVYPLFFPGGDIGKLAVCGTLNDLAVKGARPRFMTAGFVLRAGMKIEALERIVQSMAEELNKAGVQLIAGDTKVIEKGQVDDCYITTTGYGTLEHDKTFAPERIEPGDAILVSGTIGDHEAAVLLAREDFGFEHKIESDVATIWPLVEKLIETDIDVKAMRDPTRGGLATTLNEMASAAGLGMIIKEQDVPFNPAVKGTAELLGLDPYYLASEGRLIAVVRKDDAGRALEVMRVEQLGKEAAVIGEVREKPEGLWLETLLGSERPLLTLEGEQLPRIC
ncbi:hydrogenase expression/formation protein HypE [candidate division TA06 bacterium B3_TA06]|uniref:Hydrogenase expression/formation protein HypE n=1 Tax=candidate division TA06 bacterium B3_TA06 TaxID=2012487 RepID=A0A532VB13_UNCT6|nr:MAG: hydrogenase expression/formation protein HypE [candidate division TA06 bacterium B3_TA06]